MCSGSATRTCCPPTRRWSTGSGSRSPAMASATRVRRGLRPSSTPIVCSPDSIDAATTGSTVRLGHLVAPAGVRYIAFVGRAAPTSGEFGNDQTTLSDALARQLDLTLSRVDDAGLVYDNDAWMPDAFARPSEATPRSRSTAATRLSAAVRSEADGVVGVDSDAGKTKPTGPGTLLWSEAANSGWSATVNGQKVVRRDAFGWTNAFALDRHAAVNVKYSGSGVVALARVAEILLWLGVVVVWFRTRRRRTEPRPATGRSSGVGVTSRRFAVRDAARRADRRCDRRRGARRARRPRPIRSPRRPRRRSRRRVGCGSVRACRQRCPPPRAASAFANIGETAGRRGRHRSAGQRRGEAADDPGRCEHGRLEDARLAGCTGCADGRDVRWPGARRRGRHGRAGTGDNAVRDPDVDTLVFRRGHDAAWCRAMGRGRQSVRVRRQGRRDAADEFRRVAAQRDSGPRHLAPVACRHPDSRPRGAQGPGSR